MFLELKKMRVWQVSGVTSENCWLTAKSLASGTGSWESNELGESKIASEL